MPELGSLPLLGLVVAAIVVVYVILTLVNRRRQIHKMKVTFHDVTQIGDIYRVHYDITRTNVPAKYELRLFISVQVPVPGREDKSVSQVYMVNTPAYVPPRFGSSGDSDFVTYISAPGLVGKKSVFFALLDESGARWVASLPSLDDIVYLGNWIPEKSIKLDDTGELDPETDGFSQLDEPYGTPGDA